MGFEAVQPTGSHKEWGELILAWAMGSANPPGEAFNDTSAVRFVFPAGVSVKQVGAAGAGVVFPASVTEVVFVRDTSTRRYVRLPDPEMAKAAQVDIKNGDDYDLPQFYQEAPLNCHMPKTVAERLALQAERVGDYSIGSCM